MIKRLDNIFGKHKIVLQVDANQIMIKYNIVCENNIYVTIIHYDILGILSYFILQVMRQYIYVDIITKPI